jgi:uncharacterized protein (TIGR03084 family)
MNNSFPEVNDFAQECASIAGLLQGRSDADFATATLFKGWTVNDILGHLHLWNIAADQTVHDPDRFQAFISAAMSHLGGGGTHQILQAKHLGTLEGRALFARWQSYAADMAERYRGADPEARVAWAGPDMSTRSCIIARQMEHWAHAQAIFDVFGQVRSNGKRLKNIAHIGVTTYSWSFRINGLSPPAPKPYVRLTAPGGEIWEWNSLQEGNRIDGTAEDFAQVVTQCRNIADTQLTCTGDTATQWMKIAQCFAGGPETPPAAGARRISADIR